ncbi:MAG: prepilin-type N-terminal cleavage/methylation domain-containing protein [Tepidisphaeraceae bacterium]
MSNRPVRSRGFTLVELLVVIGIIALLISILLPALGQARNTAKTVKCGANLHSIMLAVHQYAAQNKGFFPGSANSTARFMYTANLTGTPGTINDDNLPEISQNWDWQAPIAKIMGIQFETGATKVNRKARFDRLNQLPQFTCPANDIIGVPNGAIGSGPTVAVQLVPSYAIAIYFHLLPYNKALNATAGTGGVSIQAYGYPYASPPEGYTPQLSKVRNPTRKIFMADGARYANPQNFPELSLPFKSGGGGAYGDHGAFSKDSNCWNRTNAPGNSPANYKPGPTDARIYAFRHGKIQQKAKADAFKFNAVFFDGHVETLGDLEGANPALWFPSGSTYNGSSTNKDCAATEDVLTRYGFQYNGTTTIP